MHQQPFLLGYWPVPRVADIRLLEVCRLRLQHILWGNCIARALSLRGMRKCSCGIDLAAEPLLQVHMLTKQP
jgi:hypothetical protein